MKLLAFRLLEESLLIMELQVPLPYAQESISGHHKPVYFSPHNHAFFLYCAFNIILSVTRTFNSFVFFYSVLIIKDAYLFLNQETVSCLPYFRLTTLHRPG